jgi:hypothetical protein
MLNAITLYVVMLNVVAPSKIASFFNPLTILAIGTIIEKSFEVFAIF